MKYKNNNYKHHNEFNLDCIDLCTNYIVKSNF